MTLNIVKNLLYICLNIIVDVDGLIMFHESAKDTITNKNKTL